MSIDLLVDFGGHWLMLMAGDVIRYVIFATGVWLLLWYVLAGPLRHRYIRSQRPPGRQLRREFFYSIRSVVVFATLALLPHLVERLTGWSGNAVARSWGEPWFWASLALMIVAHDTYFYWVHRLIHRAGLFAIAHRRHHLSNNPSPYTAYSFDIAEAVLMGSFVPIWIVLVPTTWVVLDLFVLHQIVRNTLLHSGIEVMPARGDGRPMFDWMTTTTHHDLHHGKVGWNFGLYFTWWDRLMGTEHPQYHRHFAAAVGRTPAAAVLPA